MNKQQLIEKREAIEKEREQHMASYNACTGAINILNVLIAECEKEVAEVEKNT